MQYQRRSDPAHKSNEEYQNEKKKKISEIEVTMCTVYNLTIFRIVALLSPNEMSSNSNNEANFEL